MDKAELASIFPKIWCRDTSAFPQTWTPENPAHGQCLATARIAQEHLGGNVVLAYVGVDQFIHFYNRLAGCERLDFTEDQFVEPAVVTPVKAMTCFELDEYGVFFPEIARRYNLLRLKFQVEAGAMSF
tara:strand:- start:1093 stop:1476 length:384 start_codon:yes stop_codon:yes gene_type:complete